MARQLVTNVWCDVCIASNPDEEYLVAAKETAPITIGSLRPRRIALCEVHDKELYQPFREALTGLGQVVQEGEAAAFRDPPGTAAGSGVWPCPVPTCRKHAKPFKHDQSLRNHARQVHKSTVAELARQYSEEPGDATLPLDGDAAPAQEQPVEEPQPAVTEAACGVGDCDQVFRWPAYKVPARTVAVHRAKAHGVRGERTKPKKRARSTTT